MSVEHRETRLWHPNANMAEVRGAEFVLERGEGSWIWDTAGRRYLDATSSLWYANVGHGRPEIVDAITDQLRRLDAYSVFGDYANPPALELASRLADLSPMPDSRIFLGTGGGDGVDAAAKIARRYWSAVGEPGRVHLIGRHNSFHGTNGIGTSVGGIPLNRDGFGTLLADASQIAHDSADELEREILRVGPERVAAFFVEPVVGAGGVLLPPDGYLVAVADVCRTYGVLLIADCVICGFGRLGTWYGVERWGLEPDMIVFAKGVTSGYQPLGGVVVSARVAAPFWDGDGMALRHGATYAGHPAACAAALANIDLIEREGLLERALDLEAEIAAVLAPLAGHPAVREIRAGLGVMAAVEIDPDALHARGIGIPDVALAIRDAGVLVRPLGSAVAISPPLTTTDDELRFLAAGIAEGLERSLAVAA